MQYEFNGFVLDVDAAELRTGGRVVDLQPQVFAVLAYLIEHRDRFVTKQELFDAVWGTRFVSESALTTRIKEARQAVGDDGKSQRVIKTVHGRGYRFVADVGAPPPRRAPTPIGIGIDEFPRTQYAESDGLSIAYQTFGEGPPLVFVGGFTTNVEVMWEYPAIAACFRRLASFSRVIVFDKRGTGLSDRIPTDDAPSLERRADDVRAVMDAAEAASATIVGSSEGGAFSMMFAASQPARVDRLVLHGTWANRTHIDLSERSIAAVERSWGSGRTYARLSDGIAATPTGLRFLARYERQGATPRSARRFLELSSQNDVASILPSIHVPTLVIHRRDDSVVPFSEAEGLARGIPNAKLCALPGTDHYIWSGDVVPIIDAIEEFFRGTAAFRGPSERHLASVLFVDIVGSVGMATALGDERMSTMLDSFEGIVRQCVARETGEVVKSLGDGFLAVFDGPGRAVRAANAIRDAVRSLGIDVRAGVHVAEIERRADDVAGRGVSLASRVVDAATPGEVWVTRTVTDLVAGCGLTFEPRGDHTLKGFPDPVTLLAAVDA